MATFSILKVVTNGIPKYIGKIIKDSDTHIINHSGECYEYLDERIPKFLNNKVSSESLQEYLDVSFMFKCKYGSAKITVGRLLYYTYLVYTINGKSNDKVSAEELPYMTDWLLIHEPYVKISAMTSISILRKTVNKLFHDCAAFEREIYDLIINKRLKTPKNKLEEIELYTNCKVPDMYLDSHYYINEGAANAKYVVKWIILPVKYTEFITPNYFENNELLGNISLTVDAIKRSMLLKYFIEREWDNKSLFESWIRSYSLREIKINIEKNVDE
jgi:hypothetical protein